MASIGGRPFLEILLRQLQRHGFERVLLAVGYAGTTIRGLFGDRAFGMQIVYSAEASPLGTGGAIRNAAGLIRSKVALVMNGDSYTDVPLGRLLERHFEMQADVTIAVVPADGREDIGSVLADKQGRVTRFAEKEAAGAPYLNAGIYVLATGLILEIAAGLVSLERDLLPQWARSGRNIRVFSQPAKCIDIGTPERYREALQLLTRAEPGGEPLQPGEPHARAVPLS